MVCVEPQLEAEDSFQQRAMRGVALLTIIRTRADDLRENCMWNKPIVEIRVEEYERGTLAQLMTVYHDLGLPAQLRHLGSPLNFYVPNVGRINCITQLWAFDSLADYEAKQTVLEADPSWQKYLEAAEGLIRYRENRLTRRIAFSSIDGQPNTSFKKPVVDFRTYLIHFNKMPTFLQTTEQHALKVMVRHIGPPIGYYQTTVGNLQQITHIWGYDSMGDMETRRQARNADPEWDNYLRASHGIYERQETQVLVRLKLPDNV